MEKKQKVSPHIQTITIYFLHFLLLSCASKHGWSEDIQPRFIRNALEELHQKCRLKPKSGFTADLVISGQGTARIEAIWDTQRHIQGQILNPIGEDLLNFKIDSSGLQLVDQDIQAPEDVLTALVFLAQMGTGEARALLCSGLFLTPKNIEEIETPQLNSEILREIELQGKTLWSLSSSIQFVKGPSENDPLEMRVKTKINKPVLLWKKHIADIEWQPRVLSIQTKQLDVKLSFLDFE